MKTIRVLLLSIFCCVAHFSHSQNFHADIVNGLKGGNTDLIIQHLAKTLDVKVLDVAKTGVSQDVVSNELAKFFKENPPKNFETLHSGERNNSSYVIGKLTTITGEFRVTIFFRRLNNQNFVNQLKVEKF